MPPEDDSPAGELEVLRARVQELESLNRSITGELSRTKQQLNALSAQFAAVRVELHRRDADPDMLDLGAPPARRR
ncbi:MAG: hypothetical protein WDO12_13275 [Pseudomonadota bacterium]